MEPMTPSATETPPRYPAWAPGLLMTAAIALVATGLATLPVLKVMGTLTLALLIGIGWRAAAGLPAGTAPGIRISAKTLLRLGIVLMGARLNFALVASAGPKVLLIDLMVVVTAIAGMFFLSRRMGLARDFGMLMAVGTGICGASAVVAAGTVTKADESTTSLAVGLMGILGTFGVFLYLIVGNFLGLSMPALGVLTGSTLHEVAQVVAAAFNFGPVCGDMATVVKLTRVVLLAPALVVVGLFYHLGTAEGGKLRYTWKEPPVPYFVLGFLAVGVVNSMGGLRPDVQSVLTQSSIFLMALAMAGMGLNTDLGMVKKTGWKAIALGLAGFFAIVVLSYVMIRVLGVT